MNQDRYMQHVELHAPGLEKAIRDAAHEVAVALTTSAQTLATAIGALVPPPPPPDMQITAGVLKLDPQIMPPTGDHSMATPILNTLPQHITAVWTGTDANGNPIAVVPTSVDFSVSPTGLGSLTPDADGVSGATYVANAGAVGDVTFSAVSHQTGLNDFTATPVTGTLTAVAPPAVQITAGALALDPQTPPARKR